MRRSELATLPKVFRQAGGHWSTFVIGAKNTFTIGRSDYQRQYEPILYSRRDGTVHYWCGARDQGDVWFVKKPALLSDPASRRRPCASLSLHLHQLVKETFTAKLSNMLGTHTRSFALLRMTPPGSGWTATRWALARAALATD